MRRRFVVTVVRDGRAVELALHGDVSPADLQPACVAAVVLQALAPDPGARPSTPVVFADALRSQTARG